MGGVPAFPMRREQCRVCRIRITDMASENHVMETARPGILNVLARRGSQSPPVLTPRGTSLPPSPVLEHWSRASPARRRVWSDNPLTFEFHPHLRERTRHTEHGQCPLTKPIRDPLNYPHEFVAWFITPGEGCLYIMRGMAKARRSGICDPSPLVLSA